MDTVSIINRKREQLKRVILLGIIVSSAAAINSKKKRKRRYWVRNWIERRSMNSFGSISLVHDELCNEDSDSYKNFLRMDEATFLKLLAMIRPSIQKQDTNMRLSIPPRDRLTITLRFLATGETYQSLSLSTRVPACTISKIVPECCQAIFQALQEKYLKVPDTELEWRAISNLFMEQWNFPNCIGALDGKHILFEAPKCSGSTYWNYKQSNSIILLALVDANYKFLYINAGTNGRVSDGGVFRESDLSTALKHGDLNIPAPCTLPYLSTPLPYVIVADSAFPLQQNIMKPFPIRGLNKDQRIFNYRLSRARRVVENAFGILASRFRIFLTTIKLSPEKVQSITLVCCALHNFLIMENSKYISLESTPTNGEQIISAEGSGMRSVVFQDGRPTSRAIEIRNEFMIYFNGIGKVPWQEKCI